MRFNLLVLLLGLICCGIAFSGFCTEQMYSLEYTVYDLHWDGKKEPIGNHKIVLCGDSYLEFELKFKNRYLPFYPSMLTKFVLEKTNEDSVFLKMKLIGEKKDQQKILKVEFEKIASIQWDKEYSFKSEKFNNGFVLRLKIVKIKEEVSYNFPEKFIKVIELKGNDEKEKVLFNHKFQYKKIMEVEEKIRKENCFRDVFFRLLKKESYGGTEGSKMRFQGEYQKINFKIKIDTGMKYYQEMEFWNSNTENRLKLFVTM